MSKSLEKKAEQIYNIALDEIEKEMGNKATFQYELEKLARNLLGTEFAGVFAVDEIKFPVGTKYVIFNLDSSFEPGSHWMGMVREAKNLYIYDSFGRKSIKIAPTLFGEGMRILDADDDAEQDALEENCGQRSIAWLHVYKFFGRKIAMLI